MKAARRSKVDATTFVLGGEEWEARLLSYEDQDPDLVVLTRPGRYLRADDKAQSHDADTIRILIGPAGRPDHPAL